MTGLTYDLHVVTEGAASTSGVPHEAALVAFAEAVVHDDEPALKTARLRLFNELGSDAVVDVAAVVSNFERMVRIADATGIPLDSFLEENTAGIRAELNLARFAG